MSSFWEQVKHFSPTEWRKDWTKVDPNLILTLDKIRDVVGQLYPGTKILIHVAWEDSGHSPKSYHYTGLAVDFHFDVPKNVDFNYLKQFMLLNSFREFGGIGFYPHWNHPGWHVDLRDRKPALYWFRDKDGKYHYGLDAIYLSLVERKE